MSAPHAWISAPHVDNLLHLLLALESFLDDANDAMTASVKQLTLLLLHHGGSVLLGLKVRGRTVALRLSVCA